MWRLMNAELDDVRVLRSARTNYNVHSFERNEGVLEDGYDVCKKGKDCQKESCWTLCNKKVPDSA